MTEGTSANATDKPVIVDVPIFDVDDLSVPHAPVFSISLDAHTAKNYTE